VADLQPQIDYNLHGAVTAAHAVLPAMRNTGSGTVLFTTGAGSINPSLMLGNINPAQAALRNWTINLHNELAGTGVYVGHVAIGVWIGDGPQRASRQPPPIRSLQHRRWTYLDERWTMSHAPTSA